MSHFPGNWFDFSNHKEIKRLRKDINNNRALKIQIAASVIIAIISSVFNENISLLPVKFQVLLCAGLCSIVLLIFAVPFLVSRMALRKRCNVIVQGKDAISIFDDEIIYNVLVACEYNNELKKVDVTTSVKDIETFFVIEIKYYISQSINKLSEFSANAPNLFGDGSKRIPYDRVNNVTKMIDELIDSTPSLHLDDGIVEKYKRFKESITKKS